MTVGMDIERFKRGKIVDVACAFDMPQSDVQFAYVHPKAGLVRDPGAGNAGSRIEQLDASGMAYRYAIPTRDLGSGVVVYRLWTEGEHPESHVGKFLIEEEAPSTPSAALAPHAAPTHRLTGYEALGGAFDSERMKNIAIGVAVGLFVAVVIKYLASRG